MANQGAVAPPIAPLSTDKLLVRWLLVLVAGLVLVGVCWRAWPSGRGGDGLEYLAMSEAVMRHATPDIRTSDVEKIIAGNHGPGSDGFTNIVAGAWLVHMHDDTDSNGLFRSHNSRYYSYHFWLYSLINVPALAICRSIGAPQYSSFLITNAALLLGFVVLVLCTTWDVRRKVLLVLLALGCGSTFYLPWTGPEVMCFVFILAGLTLLEARRFGWALLFFAAAAQQNPPIGLLAVIAGCAASFRLWREWKEAKKGVKQALKGLLVLVPGALVLIASPAFYWVEFGTPNLIIKAGGTDAGLMSARRLFSLLFDINQGMVVAMPALFLALLAMLLLAIQRRRMVSWVALALVACVLVMAIPALCQTNWNGGEIIISRYAYWLSAPLVYACALLMDALLVKWTFTLAAGALVAAQCAVIAWLGVFGARYFYVSESPLATWAMGHHPTWYAPIPEIFVERGNHIDGGFHSGYSYLYVHERHMTIVLSNQQRVFGLDMLCGLKQTDLPSREAEQGWAYRYLGRSCPVDMRDGLYQVPDLPVALTAGMTHAFAVASPVASIYALPGFKAPENWGVWTDQRFAVLPLRVPISVDGHEVNRWMVALTLHPFAGARSRVPFQHVIITANGQEALNVRFTSMATVRCTFVTRSMPWEDGWNALLLEFHIPTAISYRELGLSADPSRLGIGLETIKVSPVLPSIGRTQPSSGAPEPCLVVR